MTQPLKKVSKETMIQKQVADSPVTVGPTLVLMDGDHSGLTKLALCDLDAILLALGALATCAVIGADFCDLLALEVSVCTFIKTIPRR